MPARALEHVNIRTTHFAATIRFFTDIIGLKTGFYPTQAGFPGAWLYDQNNVPVLHVLDIDPFDGAMLEKVNALTYPRQVESMYGTGAIDHIAFAADDFDGMIAKLEAEQIRYKTQHIVSWLKQVFVLDPNGIVIELNFQVGERPQ